jgi:hypothetical protein
MKISLFMYVLIENAWFTARFVFEEAMKVERFIHQQKEGSLRASGIPTPKIGRGR